MLTVEPLILAIETATRAGSISLARGETILSTIAGDPAASHSTDLIGNIDTVLRRGGATLNEVELFAAATGPGSFTGLRIGLATIKSFAVNMGRPCVGISTLAAIAHSIGRKHGKVVSLLPAGRGELFAQMFSIDDETIKNLDDAEHLPPKQVLAKYGQFEKLIWAGEGAHVHGPMLHAWADSHEIALRNSDAAFSSNDERGWILAPVCNELSVSISRLGLREYERGNILMANELHATYVRPSDAKIPKPWPHRD